MIGTVKWLGGTVAALVAGIALAGGAAHADGLRWTGEVDDTAYIRIDGRTVRTDGNMRGVRDSRYDVDGKLPDRPTRVRLVNERGRGDIQIVEQPSSHNNYTAVIKVRDWQAGSSRYSFQVVWDNPRTNGYDDRNGRYDRDDRRDNSWKNGNRRDRDRDNKPGRGNGRHP